MAKLNDVFVSVVYVADERATHLGKTTAAIVRKLSSRYTNYELLVIDNGIPPAELASIKKLLSELACIRVVRLSRAHDTDTAIFAGVESAIGDIVCVLYCKDPIALIPKFVEKIADYDIVFGVANNLKRRNFIDEGGAKVFYWYSKRYLGIDIPNGATYFICMNRVAANALTRSGRFMRHIRHMSKRVGFSSTDLHYDLPTDVGLYSSVRSGTLLSRAVDLVSGYSSHPLRVLTYFGVGASILNVIYAVYVVVVNLSQQNVEKGWTTMSLQLACMFFVLFIILAVLAEYIGKILNETQQEPPYHVMQELSSTISIADETRRNVTK